MLNSIASLKKANVITKGSDDSTLRIMKHIRRAGALSRVELAQATGMAKGSITEIVGRLVVQGLLEEHISLPSGRGRPRVSLRIIEDAAYVVGLSPAGNDTLSADIIDLNGNRLFSSQYGIGGLDVATFADHAVAAIESAIVQSGIERERIRHAGIILPGQVDRNAGVILWLPHSGWHPPAAVGPHIGQAIGIPVTIDNRATVVARAEHWFGLGDWLDDFTCIALLERGMGGARYRNGHLQTGVNGSNSEIAHVKVAFEQGRPCFCGASGCLGAYASVGGIIRQWLRGGGEAEAPIGSGDFSALVDLARSGDGVALALFRSAGRALGTAIASHINEADPGHVLIVAAEPELEAMIAPAFHEAVGEHMLTTLVDKTHIEFRTIAEGDFWKGAASLALEQLYRQL
ncbi:ROK family transcriptional regulator [Sphingobium sp. YR657]|uniref:ROK family transcriptional regulator n=1 Tax=Sphingobium sp. YR657 TaxID=1884366 RepID=UPI0031377D8E